MKKETLIPLDGYLFVNRDPVSRIVLGLHIAESFEQEAPLWGHVISSGCGKLQPGDRVSLALPAGAPPPVIKLNDVDATILQELNINFILKTISPMNVEMLNDRILVKGDPIESVTKGGIIIPDTAKQKPQLGTVAAAGVNKDGVATVKVGNYVLFAQDAGVAQMVEGEEFLLMRSVDVLALVVDGQLQPIGRRLIVTRDKAEDKTSGGLYVPENAQEKPYRGLVQTTGAQCDFVRAGDKINFAKDAGYDVIVNEKSYTILNEPQLLFRIKE